MINLHTFKEKIMNKKQFLDDSSVKSFIDWLAVQLNNKNLSHHYNLPNGERIKFNGLEDALAQYNWPFSYLEPSNHALVHRGNTYVHSEVALTALSVGLAEAVENLNDAGVRDWAIAVMSWGGVRNGNVKWLEKNVNGLATELFAASLILKEGNDDENTLLPIRRFNAGMTKVYSLLVPNFIIYDSRVAAALAWLVVRWCIDKKQSLVPATLGFPCMEPKESKSSLIRKLRNPSFDNFSFPWMYNNCRNHARWNLRASWILEHVLKLNNSSEFHKQSNPLRSLEAALFMWGYDLSKSIICEDVKLREEFDVELGIDTSREIKWCKQMTLGNGKAVDFEWHFNQENDSIIIKRTNGTIETFSVDEIFQIIHALSESFRRDCFPLANSVTGMQKNTEKCGLGSTIYSLSLAMNINQRTSHAQAASQLGVALMKLGIFELCDLRPITWRLNIELPPTAASLRMMIRDAIA